MKRKRSIQRVVVTRFIAFSLGTELITSILEDMYRFILPKHGEIFTESQFFTMLSAIKPHHIVLYLLSGLLTVAVYIVGVFLFSRSVSRKLAEPVQHMANGFHEVSNGNLDVSLTFETETEFAEMRDAFNIMAQKLRDSEEKRVTMETERTRLFSHIAHDLKTPITTISGYAGALANGMVEDADKQQEYLSAIKSKSVQMNGLIDRLLSYSKLGAPQYKMNFVKIDLAELLRAACASLFGDIESKQMNLELRLPERPIFAEIDALEMSRAIGNLLTNAIRHNPSGTLLSVELTDEAEHTVIQIADSGDIIPKVIADNLFEPFVSGDDSRSSGSGTGLGLAIVKKIVEQHSGEIFLTGAPHPYTKMFVISLPKMKKDGGFHVQ